MLLNMQFNESPTELTTSATDAVLVLECIAIIVYLRRGGGDPWRCRLWCWVFGLIGCSSFLGTVAHGFIWSETVLSVLWRPLFLCLGILVALFVVGAAYDWKGREIAARMVPWSLAVGTVFFVMTEVFSGAFVVFVTYEAVAMIASFAIYAISHFTDQLRGAGVVAVAVLLNLVAAGVQASDVSFHLVFPFDHNGVFHLIQMVGLAALGYGLALGMKAKTRERAAE